MGVRSKDKKSGGTEQLYIRTKLSVSSLFGAAVAVFLTTAGTAGAATLNANAGVGLQEDAVNKAPTHLFEAKEKPLVTSAFEPMDTDKRAKNKNKNKKISEVKSLKPTLVAAGMPISQGRLSYTQKKAKIEKANIKTIVRRNEEEKIITSWLNEDALRKQVSYTPKKEAVVTKTTWKSSATDDFSVDLIKKAEPASIIDKTTPEALSASVKGTVKTEEAPKVTVVYNPEPKAAPVYTQAPVQAPVTLAKAEVEPVAAPAPVVRQAPAAPVYQQVKSNPWQTAEINVAPVGEPKVRNTLPVAKPVVKKTAQEYAELKPIATTPVQSDYEVSAQDFVRTFAPMYANGASYEEAWENRQEAALWTVPKNHQETSAAEANQLVVEKPTQKAQPAQANNINKHKWISIGSNVVARPLPVVASAKAADPKVEEFLGNAQDNNAPSWLPTENAGFSGVTNVDEKTNQQKKAMLMPLAPLDSSPVIQETAEVEPFFASADASAPSVTPANRSIIDRVKGLFSADSSETSAQAEQNYSGSLSSLFANQAAEAESEMPVLKKYAKKRQESAPMPSEIKITFPKGSADVSAATVKWLKAFSAKAAKDSRMVIEIKMSNVGLDMQGRRFAIIRNILTSNNVPADRINPVLTTRNPDTVILKTSVMPQEDGNIPVIDAMGGSYLDATPQK
ncbi:MAG: hypothetical protein IKD08_03275 [Alphaproteobacteria bacterium]|nr:hypothetical protein [Alphaproteobacteria bacterium]